MGNRASISIENCSNGIYLHWNGGRGSVMAFVEEANKRFAATGFVEESGNIEVGIDSDRYLMELYACIREFFNFSGEKKFRGRRSLSLYLSNEKYLHENGHYHVMSNGNIDFTDARTIETDKYTKDSFNGIKAFFAESEALMLNAEWGEATKTPGAAKVLQLMDSEEDGDTRYSEFVDLVSKELGISTDQLDSELKPFI